MDLTEAIDAAMSGKKVSFLGDVAEWTSLGLQWVNDGEFVPVNAQIVMNKWQIVPDPPKTYTFMEAVEMMKNHKRMRSMYDGRIYSAKSWIRIPCIEGMWQEAE